MCSRFVLYSSPDAIQYAFAITDMPDQFPRQSIVSRRLPYRRNHHG
jgi:hypothetical protein